MEIIKYLDGAYHTMDGIAVTGLENMSKFLGAANAIMAVSQELKRREAQNAELPKEEGSEEK